MYSKRLCWQCNFAEYCIPTANLHSSFIAVDQIHLNKHVFSPLANLHYFPRLLAMQRRGFISSPLVPRETFSTNTKRNTSSFKKTFLDIRAFILIITRELLVCSNTCSSFRSTSICGQFEGFFSPRIPYKPIQLDNGINGCSDNL